MTRLRLKKRGQAVYIIIGVMILIASIFGSYLYSSDAQEKAAAEAERVLKQSVIPSLNTYMRRSMEEASIDLITDIGTHGGTFDPNSNIFWGSSTTEIALTCKIGDPSKACVNTMRTRQQVEEELAARILAKLDGIINLSGYRAQGIDIKEGERKVDVTLGKTTLIIELYYPLELSIKNKVEKIDTFQVTIKLPLGMLYDLSNYITNTEIQEEEFNIPEWNQKHPDLFIMIESEYDGKNKKFQLGKDGYAYNFALEKTGFNPAANGCCYNQYDFLCFKNVLQEQCDAMGGQYDPNNLCYCPTEGSLSCVVSLPYAGCTDPYTEVMELSDDNNAHAALPDHGGFSRSLCCNIIAFTLTQQPDTVGTDCTGGAKLLRLSSEENAHAEEAGVYLFGTDVCISADNNVINCLPREGICKNNEESVISLTSDRNAHVGYAFLYEEKICCETEKD